MTRITQSLSSIPNLLTHAQLYAMVGQPLSFCPLCGSAIYSVKHTGELVCWGCNWQDIVDGTFRAALVLIAVRAPDGTFVAADRTADLAQRVLDAEIDQANYYLDRPDGRHWIIVDPRHPLSSRLDHPGRGETFDEFWERLKEGDRGVSVDNKSME